MLRFALIFEGSPFDRKGLFNAVHERLKALHATGECVVDTFCIHAIDNAFTRRVRHTPDVPRVEDVVIEGIRYRMLWYRFSIIDHITLEILHQRPLLFTRFLKRDVQVLKGYDALIAHSFAGGLFAYEAHRNFGLPYFMTWHGSDIHTHPWRNPVVLRHTEMLMRHAAHNFFVSSALKTESDRIAVGVPKTVLYNGIGDSFVRYSDQMRGDLRREYSLDDDVKVVAFVGNVVAVKNVGVLSSVFRLVRERFEGKLRFWVIGDGKLRQQVETDMKAVLGLDVRFWGNVPYDRMPFIMNCIDVMVLPSINEGLPLVCAEAVSCGAAVVGSDAGGIPEVIGKDYVVPSGAGLSEGLAQKILWCLKEPVEQILPAGLSWKTTAATEISIMKSALAEA